MLLAAAVAAAVAGVAIVASAVLLERPAANPAVPAAFRDWPTVRARVGGREVLLVVAVDKARGLMDVEDLGDLDGMLFDYRDRPAPVTSRFWMEGVRIPLDVAFFDGSARVIEQVPMALCPPLDPATGRCPQYGSREPFVFALETPARSLVLDAGARLELPARTGSRAHPGHTPALSTADRHATATSYVARRRH